MDKKQNSDQQFQTWEEEKVTLLSRLKEAEKSKEEVVQLKKSLQQKDQELAASQKILGVKENVIFLNTQKIQEQEETIKELNNEVDILKDYLRAAKQKMFGRSTEKVDLPYPQFSFMDDCVFNEEPKDDNKDDSKDEKEKKKRKRGKRKPLPENLPKKTTIHDLKEEEKICKCGCELHKIRDDITRKLEVIPQQIFVHEHVRPIYGCKGCSKTIKKASLPHQILPKSMAGESLLAYVACAKYCDHLPFYRQEQIWKRAGIDVDQSSLARWVLAVGHKVAPLIELMKKDILKGNYIQADETTVQVLDEKEEAENSKSYMWVYKSGGNGPSKIIYKYADTRKGLHAKDFLKGWSGYLQTDAYAGYKKLDKVIHCGCMAHARRKFVEIVKITKKKDTLAHQALLRFKKLYKIEEKIKNLPPDEKKRMRQKEAVPILRSFKEWLDYYSEKVPPQSMIGKAISYSRNNWTELTKYVNEGFLEIDNNATERSVKPFALGRKNWLFMGNPDSAQASANLYSLIETCKSHNLNPYNYLKDIFEKLANPKISLSPPVSLLPYNWKPAENNPDEKSDSEN